MEERQVLSGVLSKDSGFRLLVTGNAGVRELGVLIKKLQFDILVLEGGESSFINSADVRGMIAAALTDVEGV